MWRAKNKDHNSALIKTWEQNNVEAKRKHRRDWARRDRAKGRKIREKIHDNIRSKVWLQLKKGKNRRSTFALLGYTAKDLMQHLENKFTEGMTWENYGEWHIDHIRPRISFNVTSTDCEDFKRCWALSNLQPLWGLENWGKGSRWTKH